MEEYSPCVEKLKLCIEKYISNPSINELVELQSRVPEFILDRLMVAELSESINSSEKYSYQIRSLDLNDEYLNLMDFSFDEVKNKCLKDDVESIQLDVSKVIERVLNPNNNDYVLARNLARDTGNYFGM